MEEMLPVTIRKKAYLRIVGTIMDMIAEGKVQYGERLYNEQELIEMLDVSRPTLREALRVLEFLGIATVVPHKGITINKPTQESGYLPLLYILAFEKTTNKELFELRQALQMEMAAQAAAHSTWGDIQELRELIGQMETQKTADYVTLSRLDDAFHQRLLSASRNKLVCKLMETVRPMIRKQLEGRIENLTLEEVEGTIADHKRIVDCLEKGDGIGARQAMYLHLAASRRFAGNDPIEFPKFQ